MIDKDSIIVSLEFVGLVLGVLSLVALLRLTSQSQIASVRVVAEHRESSGLMMPLDSEI